MMKYLEFALSQEVYEYLEELDEMNWSARGNVFNQYLSNTSIGTTVIYYVNISLYNSIMKSTYMCFLKDLNENRPRLALILRLTAIVGVDMMINSKN